MLKIEPTLPRLPGVPAAASPVSASLPVGTLMAVEAIRDNASGQMLLLLAGRKFVLKPGGAASEVQPGTRLTVRVARAEPDIELALVPQPDDVAAALRRELPQQGSPLRLLANLEWLAATAQAPTAPGSASAAETPAPPLARLPPVAAQAVQAVLNGVPQARELATPEGLEKALLASGVRLESLIAANPKDLASTLGSDWKATLLRLKDTLIRAGGTRVAAAPGQSDAPLPTRHGQLNPIAREAPSLSAAVDPDAMLGQLVQQAQESISRVTCNQLASLDPRQQTAFPMVMEIPYRQPAGAGLLRVRVDREAHAQSSTAVWSVDFALDLGAYGPLRGRVTLAEGRVSVSLQPEQAALAQAIDTRVDELRQTLADAGLPIGKLSCSRSDPVMDSSPTGSWLVNLRA